MRPWIIIVLSLIALFVVFGKPSTSAHTNQSIVHQPANAVDVLPSSEPVGGTSVLRFDLEVDGAFLLQAIKNHPMPEVSQVLWSKIESGEIAIRGLDRPEASARFVPRPTFDREHKMVGLYGVLSVSPQTIFHARVGRSLERKYLDTVLLHESVHYEQIASGRFASTVITDPSDSPDQCEAGWNLEREAYVRECEFARAIGFDRLPYCASDPQAFDRALFAALSAGRPDSCPAHWRRMLGI